MDITPQGQLVTANAAGEVIERDLVTLQPTGVRFDATRPGYPGVVYWADGARLATTYGREMTVWDVARHESIGDPLPADENSTVNVTAGRYAVTIVDGKVVRWDLDDAGWPKIACASAGRNMTRQEWELYGPRDAPYGATCPEYDIDQSEEAGT